MQIFIATTKINDILSPSAIQTQSCCASNTIVCGDKDWDRIYTCCRHQDTKDHTFTPVLCCTAAVYLPGQRQKTRLQLRDYAEFVYSRSQLRERHHINISRLVTGREGSRRERIVLSGIKGIMLNLTLNAWQFQFLKRVRCACHAIVRIELEAGLEHVSSKGMHL